MKLMKEGVQIKSCTLLVFQSIHWYTGPSDTASSASIVVGKWRLIHYFKESVHRGDGEYCMLSFYV